MNKILLCGLLITGTLHAAHIKQKAKQEPARVFEKKDEHAQIHDPALFEVVQQLFDIADAIIESVVGREPCRPFLERTTKKEKTPDFYSPRTTNGIFLVYKESGEFQAPWIQEGCILQTPWGDIQLRYGTRMSQKVLLEKLLKSPLIETHVCEETEKLCAQYAVTKVGSAVLPIAAYAGKQCYIGVEVYNQWYALKDRYYAEKAQGIYNYTLYAAAQELQDILDAIIDKETGTSMARRDKLSFRCVIPRDRNQTENGMFLTFNENMRMLELPWGSCMLRQSSKETHEAVKQKLLQTLSVVTASTWTSQLTGKISEQYEVCKVGSTNLPKAYYNEIPHVFSVIIKQWEKMQHRYLYTEHNHECLYPREEQIADWCEESRIRHELAAKMRLLQQQNQQPASSVELKRPEFDEKCDAGEPKKTAVYNAESSAQPSLTAAKDHAASKARAQKNRKHHERARKKHNVQAQDML